MLLIWEVQWPSALCMITSYAQISPVSLVCKQNSSHLHTLGVNILFNCSALGIYLSGKTWRLFDFKTRLGGEIYSSDVNIHEGHLCLLFSCTVQMQ